MPFPRKSRTYFSPSTEVVDPTEKHHPFKRSRHLRKEQTHSEDKLWQALRRKQIQDVRFRRQVSLGPYFVDFVCLKARLVIEVDGVTHITAEEIAYDKRRTQWLKSQGFKVIRFWNLDVLTNLDRVIEQIDIEVSARLSTPPRA
jgi:very-short-patch-repair endonuclease